LRKSKLPKYLEKLQTFCFSNSSINSFENCAYGFKLNYLLKRKQVGNFFSDFGSFCHDVLFKYFNDELEIYELLDYYKNNYDKHVVTQPPSFMQNATLSYYNAGENFFKNFDFDKNKYEVLIKEEYAKGYDRDIYLVIKPDLVLRNKETGEVVLWDYKTSEIKKGKKIDEEKLNGYKNQLMLYVNYLYQFKNIEVKNCRLWFIRSNTYYDFEYNAFDALDITENFINKAKEIKETKKFPYNNTDYFQCNVICSCRNWCKYRAKK
jgi:hypothetical protein